MIEAAVFVQGQCVFIDWGRLVIKGGYAVFGCGWISFGYGMRIRYFSRSLSELVFGILIRYIAVICIVDTLCPIKVLMNRKKDCL